MRVTVLSLLLASATAFQASLSPAFAAPKIAVSNTARHVLLTDEETDAILQSADECAAGECSIDDVAELIYELKEQEKLLEERLDTIMNMISHLQHVNEKEERQTDEVRAFVRDMLRVFDTEKPGFFPAGFSGDVGKGATTAYDALPPKKWKPSNKD